MLSAQRGDGLLHGKQRRLGGRRRMSYDRAEALAALDRLPNLPPQLGKLVADLRVPLDLALGAHSTQHRRYGIGEATSSRVIPAGLDSFSDFGVPHRTMGELG